MQLKGGPELKGVYVLRSKSKRPVGVHPCWNAVSALQARCVLFAKHLAKVCCRTQRIHESTGGFQSCGFVEHHLTSLLLSLHYRQSSLRRESWSAPGGSSMDAWCGCSTSVLAASLELPHWKILCNFEAMRPTLAIISKVDRDLDQGKPSQLGQENNIVRRLTSGSPRQVGFTTGLKLVALQF